MFLKDTVFIFISEGDQPPRSTSSMWKSYRKYVCVYVCACVRACIHICIRMRSQKRQSVFPVRGFPWNNCIYRIALLYNQWLYGFCRVAWHKGIQRPLLLHTSTDHNSHKSNVLSLRWEGRFCDTVWRNRRLPRTPRRRTFTKSIVWRSSGENGYRHDRMWLRYL